MKNDQGAAQSTPELLPVVQADRKSAAEYSQRPGSGHYKRIIGGEMDHLDLVQAFARHRIEHSTPDHNAAEEVRDMLAAYSKVQGVLGPQDREGLLLAIRALTSTPEPTDHAGVSEMAQVPVCRSCGEPSPNGDPCETCVECERILAMSDEEVVAEAGPEGMAWARGFKEGLRTGLSARTPPVLEEVKEALEMNLETLGEERRRCARWGKSHHELDTAIEETAAALDVIKGAGQ